MLRFLLFFAAVFFLTGLLAQVPVVGGLFRIPFLGFWFTAILLSAVLAKAGTEAVDAGRRRALRCAERATALPLARIGIIGGEANILASEAVRDSLKRHKVRY